jgi:hypothetical protein
MTMVPNFMEKPLAVLASLPTAFGATVFMDGLRPQNDATPRFCGEVALVSGVVAGAGSVPLAAR